MSKPKLNTSFTTLSTPGSKKSGDIRYPHIQAGTRSNGNFTSDNVKGPMQVIRNSEIGKRQSGDLPPHGVAWRYVPGAFGLGELVLSVIWTLDQNTLINNF